MQGRLCVANHGPLSQQTITPVLRESPRGPPTAPKGSPRGVFPASLGGPGEVASLPLASAPLIEHKF